MRVPARIIKVLSLLPGNFIGTVVLTCNAVTRSWALEITSKEQVRIAGEEELVDLHDLLEERRE